MSVFTKLLATAENHIVARNELSVCPDMQMREKMNHEQIEYYANGAAFDDVKALLTAHPIEIVIVENALGEDFYIVDGFHRYFGARKAELQEIPVIAYRGTYDEAYIYAMSKNHTNGLSLTSDDVSRSVKALLKVVPKDGYDSSIVNKWFESVGINRSTAENHTSNLIKEINDRRDQKILELKEEGLSQRKIAEVVGCSVGTINTRLKGLTVQKTPEGKSEHHQSPSEPIAPIFDEEDEDLAPAINPYQATEKVLRDADDTVVPNVPLSGHNPLRDAEIAEALRILEQALANEHLNADHKLTWGHLQNTYGN